MHAMNVAEKTPYWVEIARHPQGFVLFVCSHQKFRPPWVALKLKRPKHEPGRSSGERKRVWLHWNADRQELGRNASTALLADQIPDISDWVVDVLLARQAE
jgi:hypothetical protein